MIKVTTLCTQVGPAMFRTKVPGRMAPKAPKTIERKVDLVLIWQTCQTMVVRIESTVVGSLLAVINLAVSKHKC